MRYLMWSLMFWLWLIAAITAVYILSDWPQELRSEIFVKDEIYHHNWFDFIIIWRVDHDRFFVKNDTYVYLIDDWYLWQLEWIDTSSFEYKWPAYYSDKNGVYYLALFDLKLDYSDILWLPVMYRTDAKKNARLLNLENYWSKKFLYDDQGFKSIQNYSYDENKYASDEDYAYSKWIQLNGVDPKRIWNYNHYWLKNSNQSDEWCVSKIVYEWGEACCDSVLRWSSQDFQYVWWIYWKDDKSVYAIWFLPEDSPVCYPLDVDVTSFEVLGVAVNILPKGFWILSKDKFWEYVSEIDLEICHASSRSIDYPIRVCSLRTWLFPIIK